MDLVEQAGGVKVKDLTSEVKYLETAADRLINRVSDNCLPRLQIYLNPVQNISKLLKTWSLYIGTSHGSFFLLSLVSFITLHTNK